MMEREGGGKEGRTSSLSYHRTVVERFELELSWDMELFIERDKAYGEVLCSVCCRIRLLLQRPRTLRSSVLGAVGGCLH